MAILRKTRYIWWFVTNLASRYTRYLALGFVTGFITTTFGVRIIPFAVKLLFSRTEYIGLVGDITTSTIPLSIQNQISMGLTTLADNGTVLPGLADNWESTDSGRLYVFHLRRDIYWHNGKQVTASDINYNIKNVTFTVVDEETLAAKLDYPYSPFPVLVSKPLFKQGLIGAGKFRVGTINFSGDKIKSIKIVPLAGSSNSPNKEYRFYTTENQAMTAYKLGEIERVEEITNPQLLAGWGKDTIIEHIRYNRIISIYFNLKKDIINDKNFRQGLAYALPNFTQEKASSPIPLNSWGYTDKVKIYDPDPDLAKKLLKPFQTASDAASLQLTTFSYYLDTAQAIANSWSEYGIRTEVKIENSVPSDYQVLITAADVPPDPDQYPLWHSTQPGNITGYVNVKIDKLLEDGRQEMDMEKRKKIYADFAKRIVDDAPVIFLYYPKTYTIKRK